MMTVSRVLHSPEQVAAETRGKVLRAIDALSYAPNEGARLLRSRASRAR
jgi:DNA-binding LacI/PurR family transcriptional regulator